MKTKRVRWRRGVILIALLTPIFTLLVVVASIGGATSFDSATGAPNLSAAVVNNDALSMTDPTAAKSGLAGRLLVGELVSATDSGFSWTITNESTAQAGLADGTYAAVVTIPAGFTAAYISSTTAHPIQATLSVQTDGSQSYLTALLARALASNLQQSISNGLTKTFVNTLLIAFTGVSEGLGDVAAGATGLSEGLGAMSTLSSSLPGLTKDLASGSRLVTNGVYALSDALWKVGAANDDVIADAGTLASDIASLQTLAHSLPASAEKTQILTELTSLTTLAQTLSSSATDTSLAVDAGALAAGIIGDGASLVTDGNELLADGMPLFSKGLSGATAGASLLANGLNVASEALPKYSAAEAAQLAKVITQPVVSEVTSVPALPSPGAAITAFSAPIALWLGALVLALVYAPFERRTLSSRASTGRLVWGSALPPVIIAVMQSALVIGGVLLLGVRPSHMIGFDALLVVASISFVLLHQGLAAVAGRSAWLASVALLGLQIVAAGVILPAHYLPGWVQALGNVLPLSQAISASQEFLTGGSFSLGVSSIVWLIISAIVGVALLYIAVLRGRRVAMSGDLRHSTNV